MARSIQALADCSHWLGNHLRLGLDALHPRYIDVALSEEPATDWHPNRPGDYCSRCGSTIGPHGASVKGCSICIDTALPWQHLVRLGAYESPLMDWILALKYHRQWHWGQWLGRQLAEVIPPSPDDRMTAICPVPMHWRRRWNRHYNQAMLIARGICEHRPWPMLDLLVRHVHRPSQTHVAPAARRENVRHCMKALPYDLRGWHIWLVDDVKTSGATLSQCARLLQERGAESIHVAVACVANPRDHQ